MINPHGSHAVAAALYRFNHSLKKIRYLAGMVGALAQAVFAADTLSTWLYNTPITLNTSTTGAKTTTTQKNFPVLIRLTSLNAAAVFATAQANGGDLRFSHAGDTGQIPYELNKYDPVHQRAVIWVKADSVQGNNASQSIRMWWGKSGAATTSDSSKVFAPTNGFALVWHLNKSSGSGTPASPFIFGDATGQGRTGLGYGTVDSPSVIDSGRAFNEDNGKGTDTIVVASLLGSPSALTMSAWVKVDSIHDSASSDPAAEFFNIGGFVDFKVRGKNTTALDSLRATYYKGTGGSSDGQYFLNSKVNVLKQGWKYVTYVCDPTGTSGTKFEQGYVNGGAVGAAATNTDAIDWAIPINTANDDVTGNTKLGARSGLALSKTDTSRLYGIECEFRVDNVVRPADWLKLCFENQQASDSLTSLNATGPGVPTLSLPSNNAVGQPLTLTLSWNTASLATSYDVQVATTSTFAGTVFEQPGLLTTSQSPAGLASGTFYYWRVNATGASGTSAWSAVWTFTTATSWTPPPLTAPANNAINQALSTNLTWVLVTGASSYEVQVSADSTFGSTFLDQSGIAANSLNVPGLTTYTTYYWRANAYDNTLTQSPDPTAWAAVWSFTTIIGQPVLSTPANGAVNQAVSLSLNWGAVTGAASYALQVSTASGFGTTVFSQSGLSGLSQTLGGLTTSKMYYWEVNATGGNGGTGAWSAMWSFTTVPPAPGVPVLSTPANGASNQPLSPTLTWGTVATASVYEVQVSMSSGFSSTILDQPGITGASQAIGPLGFATVYYWRVNASNIGGTSVWSGVYRFTTVEDYTTWSHHMPIPLNTSASGANVANNVYNFPVLVRLTSSNFSGFGSVQAGGADIRFSKTDYTKPLPFQIQRWDATDNLAEIWVLLDTVLGNSSTQTIVMHYGNSGAVNLSSGPSVFSLSNGFVAVWHLSDLTDATGAYGLYTSGNSAPTKAQGLIDTCYSFTGTSGGSYLANKGSYLGSHDTLTISSWVSLNSSASGDGQFIWLGNAAGIRACASTGTGHCMMYDTNATTANFADFQDGPTVKGLGWQYIAGVFNPVSSNEFYWQNDSIPASVVPVTGSHMGTQNHAIVYGGTGEGDSTLLGTGTTATTAEFNGLLNEIRVEDVPRNAAWLKLCFQNQQANQTLVVLATLPSIPTLALPTNNAVGQPTSLTLSWNSVSGALTYEVRVATAAGFGVATVSDQAGLTGVSATAAGLAGSTTCYWEVNATNGAGTTAWSAVWSFTTTIGSPALSSPANGATGQPLTLSLSWGSVSGAISYGVQVSTDMFFGSTVSGQTGLTGLYGVVTGLSGGVTYYWEANATGAAATGAWSGVWSFSAGMTQVIPLNTAWNMKSLNVIPLQDTTTAVFGTDPGGFLFVKDNAGDVYCPAAYQDNINYVQVGQGYQVYSTVADTMEVLGIPVNYATTPIALSSGWNMIAYLPPTDDSIEHALAGIDTLIIIVKNNSGHAYWPSLGIDDIGIMYVGEGYKVLMSSAASLTYPMPDTGVAKRVAARGVKTMLRLPDPRHYAAHVITGNNATLLAKRVTIGDKVVADSSEIGAFDGSGSLVGSGTVIHGIAAFAVWGIDPQSKTKKKDGCAVSEVVTFRLWDGKREYPLDYVTQNGTPAKYGVDKVYLGVLSVPDGYLITKFDLTRAYPNPFRGSVKIAFDVPTIGGVTQHAIELAVYDLKGSLVKQLASGLYRAGHYSLAWNSGEGRESAVGSSVYIVRMKAANFDKRIKLVRMQ